MSVFLLVVVCFMIILAVMGLCVGVNNDASNFLSSAVGTKSASYRAVTVIASLGIICGAAMSNGMMEIARNGVITPEYFTATEVIYIFLAVMITNLIVLDLFNNLGMPTSTSVLLVFELLGGTIAIALLKMKSGTADVGLAELVNTGKTFEMILGIFLSVAIAFVFGFVVQWITRLIFSFNYKINLKWKVGLFCGVATTALSYFMIFKGLKNASFVSDSFRIFVDENIGLLLGLCLVFFSIVMQVLHFLKVNVLKLVILIGTFALAMAFAGNDLVNFIGVPLAGLDTYLEVRATGISANELTMESLNSTSTSGIDPIFYLLIASGIMIIQLMTSQKVKLVMQTNLNLAKQNGGNETFGSSMIARSIVRISTGAANFFRNNLSSKSKEWLDKRFNSNEAIVENEASFDLVRGLVNLVIASMLIALGTSMKLPLSTTYVAFMVSMGTSLADRAWSRESAVYRVTGVFSVIGGWLFTAFGAFILSLVLAVLFHYTGAIGMIIMIILAIYFKFSDKSGLSSKEKEDTIYDTAIQSTDKAAIFNLMMEHHKASMLNMLDFSKNTYIGVIDYFLNEDVHGLRKIINNCVEKKVEMKVLKRKEIQLMRRLDTNVIIKKNTKFHICYNYIEQILYSLRRICDPVKEYVDNSFTPLNEKYINELKEVQEMVLWVMDAVSSTIHSSDYKDVDVVCERLKRREDAISEISIHQMDRVQDAQENIEISLLYLNIIQESYEIVYELRHFLKDISIMNEK